MGGKGNCHAHFKKQGAVPVGVIRWKMLASVSGLGHSPAERTGEIEEQEQATAGSDWLTRLPAGQKAVEPFSGDKVQAFLLWIRSHRVLSWLIVAGIAIIALSAFTDAVDRLLTLLRK